LLLARSFFLKSGKDPEGPLKKTEAVYALIAGPRLLKHPAPQAFRKSPKL
jgi:hypothetical protein